ncbi:MAG TPA: C69 family dipeptidase [Blastocatellia bacterium]|nr:C69 family dipeptidase [Blastocatellia bacterium]
MCDTIVAVPPATRDGSVWFGKNSDREPGEAQIVEHLPERRFLNAEPLQCTHIQIPRANHSNEIIISRPFWMWGAEMGANSHGVAIGNEAVFTRLPYDKTGLTGMDLLRLALERASAAREALELITALLSRPGQGGGCGYRHRSFRYHNSFIIADPTEAFVLETAGPFWAAQQVRGIRTISNALSIGADFDLISPEAYSFARAKGWCRSSADFDFARCFSDPRYSFFSGAAQRSSCTLQRLTPNNGGLGFDHFAATLRDHAGVSPRYGRRMQMPCAHASWWPMRRDGQTTGSMISRLSSNGRSLHWMTGTSSPCLSVFKPIVCDGTALGTGPAPEGRYDTESLLWRHEKLHRLVLTDYSKYAALFESDRTALESESVAAGAASGAVVGLQTSVGRTIPGAPGGNSQYQPLWEKHRQIIPEWTSRVLTQYRPGSVFSPFQRYWRKQNRLDLFAEA